MDGRVLRDLLIQLAKTIPLEVGENPFSNVLFHVNQLEQSINVIIQRAEYQQAKRAAADQKLAMDKRAASDKTATRRLAKKKAEQELALAGHDYVKPTTVTVKQD